MCTGCDWQQVKCRSVLPQADKPAVDKDGWFETGDVATIDRHGFMAVRRGRISSQTSGCWLRQQAGAVATPVLPLLQIVDRSKDVIKSGGEWISSIEVENAASGHPKVAVAAVIGVHHAKWGERPLLVVQSRDKAAPPSSDEMRQYLKACLRPLAFHADTEQRFADQLRQDSDAA